MNLKKDRNKDTETGYKQREGGRKRQNSSTENYERGKKWHRE
jgi:hypothetical protein